MIKQLSPNTYQICCDYCHQPVTAPVQAEKRPVVRGGVECPDCLELVDDGIANAYIAAMQEAGQARRRRRLDAPIGGHVGDLCDHGFASSCPEGCN